MCAGCTILWIYFFSWQQRFYLFVIIYGSNWQEAIFKSSKTWPRFASDHSLSITCYMLFELGTPRDNFVVWERLLFKNFRSSYLQNENIFFAHFSPIFSKSVCPFNKMFQFKKYGTLYELLFWWNSKIVFFILSVCVHYFKTGLKSAISTYSYLFYLSFCAFHFFSLFFLWIWCHF